jgi:hypothetical protein
MSEPTEIEILRKELEEVRQQKAQVEERLKKYTAPKRSKKYYETHKEEIKQKVKEYKERTNYSANLPKEKKAQYNKNAYQRRKQRLLEQRSLEQEQDQSGQAIV